MNKKRFIIETMTGKTIEEWEENNRKLKEQKELHEIINGLTESNNWRKKAKMHYFLSLKKGKSHEEAVAEMYAEIRKELIKSRE